MSCVTFGRVSGGTARRFSDDVEPRRPFGIRGIDSEFGPDGMPLALRSMDRGTAEIRRRIKGAPHKPVLSGRLSWAVAGLAAAGLSSLMWLDAHGVASVVARGLSGLL